MRLTLLSVRPEGDSIPTVFSIVFGIPYSDIESMTAEDIFGAKGGTVDPVQFRRDLLVAARDAINDTLAAINHTNGSEPGLGGKHGQANHTKAQGNT